MLSGIYEIRNKIDNKVYVGSSKDIKVRLLAHKNMLKRNKHANIHLQNAWNKFGKNNFDFNMLCYYDVANLIQMEQRFIDINNSCDQKYGYNIVPFADRRELSEETKRKIGDKHRGKIMSIESRRLMSLSRKGKKHTPESIKKMKDAAEGRMASNETRKKISITSKGRKHSLETRQKISKRLKGRKITEMTRSKIRGFKNSNFKFISEDIVQNILKLNNKNIPEYRISKICSIGRKKVKNILNGKYFEQIKDYTDLPEELQ